MATFQQQQPDEGFVDETITVWVRGLYDYQGTDASALSFDKGAIIAVFNQLDTGWWDGVLDDERGWFPSNYVQILTPAETAAHLATLYDPSREQQLQPPHQDSSAYESTTDGGMWSGTEGRSDSGPRVQITARPQSMADDFWMPQFSADGQIYYLNSKTGETSRDMPSGTGSVIDSAIELSDTTHEGSFISAYDVLRGRSASSAGAPSEVPSSWVKRLADDGISHYWFNTATGEAQWHDPTPARQPKPIAPAVTAYNDEFENEDAGYQALRRGFSNDPFPSMDPARRISAYSEASEAPSFGEAANIPNFLSNSQHTQHPQSSPSQPSPEVIAERNAKDLQFHLAPKSSETFSDLAVLVKKAINEIVQASPSTNPNDPAEAALVMDRVSAVVVAVRNLLYTSGTLAAPLASLLPQTAEAAESSRSPMLELRPYQRKVTATLSKLVLSARATKSNLSSRTGPGGPAFDARVDLDALELDRAIMTLVQEIQRASVYGRAKRLHAVFDSPDGVAGIGLGNPGGGVGGNMKAFGFVPGDDAVDRLVLGPNLLDDMEAHRLKVEEQLRPLENPTIPTLVEQGPIAVTELASLLAVVEDIDVASYIDVTGARGTGDDYTASVKEGQTLVRQLEWSKQAIFDEGMRLLMLCEGERNELPSREIPESSTVKATAFARSIRGHILSVQKLVGELIHLAELQARARRGSILAGPSAASGGRGANGLPQPRINGNTAQQPLQSAQRDSMALPSFDAPDSPLHVGVSVSEEAQAATAQLQRMAELDVGSAFPPDDGEEEDEDYVGMEDAFGSARRALPPQPSRNPLVDSMPRSTTPTPISIPTTNGARADDATPLPPGVPPKGRSVPMPADDSDDEDLRATTSRSPAKRKGSNKLMQLLGEEIPMAAEKPWYLKPGYTDKELLFTPDGNEIRGGTLRALVERLTYHQATDTAFNEAFLITFRSFTTPSELIDELILRFEKPAPEGLTGEDLADWERNWQETTRARIVNTMRRLLVEEDCITLDDTEALDKMRAFVSKHEGTYVGVKMVASTLQTLLSTGAAPQRKLSRTMPVGAPQPIVPKQGAKGKLKFSEMDPLEVARQLTLMESELFSKIRGPECLARAEGGQADNDNIKAVILMSNKVADWVNEVILEKEDPKRRALLIRHFILITDKCRMMNNFSTMAALVAALNSPPIRRLKRSWDSVNNRYIALLDDIEALMQAGKSLPEYRQMLSRVTLPCIPFIGVYLTTLTFIQDGMKDKLVKENNVINFLKRSKASAIITEIKKYQSVPYNLLPVETIRGYLEEALKVERPNDFYWELSLQREPRERDDEKMARLLQESGFL
ncbi:ras GEF [Clavulina sp. PMI_390]|nr:ras GEF [Clavulina sp. PMI_390]